MSAHEPRTERGASSVEYGLLAAAVAAVIVLVLFAVGAFTGEMFTETCDSFDAASSLTAAGDCP